MSKKPTVLLIMDGFGLNDRHEANAVYEANTPNIDKLMEKCPFVKGNASGLAVGLPDGQMGNSEVGHLNMGARITLPFIYMDYYPMVVYTATTHIFTLY